MPEASFLRLLHIFPSILWRIDEADIVTEWERLTEAMHMPAMRDSDIEDNGTPGFRSFTAKEKALFTDDPRSKRSSQI